MSYKLFLQVVVNAGNGSGGFFTWNVLDKLGADTFGSLHLEPDGMFPNHIPNPEDRTAMSLTRAAVLEQQADLGIVFDTDVDRSGVVDSTGTAINGDRLIALMAAIVLREHPGTTVVTDARTSVALTQFIAALGGHHCLYRVGYRNVIDKGIQLNRDGIIIEMVRMKLMGSSEGIGSLIKELKDPLESVELRMNILTQPKHAKQKGAEVVDTLKQYIEVKTLLVWHG
ncbi:hypothetical protein GW17_00052880 [Ensete ventricosum]|nr:hypothetical protein GW17_00052880 [Ensete ventricosum]RZS01077.1 hypothetical protein BHM03_00030875 [Ensete ventricosum]